jgi:hypothetical protein
VVKTFFAILAYSMVSRFPSYRRYAKLNVVTQLWPLRCLEIHSMHSSPQ